MTYNTDQFWSMIFIMKRLLENWSDKQALFQKEVQLWLSSPEAHVSHTLVQSRLEKSPKLLLNERKCNTYFNKSSWRNRSNNSWKNLKSHNPKNCFWRNHWKNKNTRWNHISSFWRYTWKNHSMNVLSDAGSDSLMKFSYNNPERMPPVTVNVLKCLLSNKQSEMSLLYYADQVWTRADRVIDCQKYG